MIKYFINNSSIITYIFLSLFLTGCFGKQVPGENKISTEKNLGECTNKNGSIYCFDVKIDEADPDTFKFISDQCWGFWKDKNHVYRQIPQSIGSSGGAGWAVVTINADPKTFRVIKNCYSKDANYVYDGGEIIEGADPRTFTVE